MNANEFKAAIELQLVAVGVTEEIIINRYGSVNNWCNTIMKTLEGRPSYEKVFGKNPVGGLL